MKTLLPHYFTSSCDGALYDTRRPDWSATPLRPLYSRTCRDIETGADLRATLRAGETAWPGCYPLYFITDDGEALSFDAVRENLRAVLYSIKHDWNDGWRVVTVEVNYENHDLTCIHTGKPIAAAYAD